MILLNDTITFPSVELAEEDGLLAAGGELSTDRLLLAYRSGIFPWYNEDEPILWWSPDPRSVIFPAGLKISKSMQSVLNNGKYRFTINKAFEKVITNCKHVNAIKHSGTWISESIIQSYVELHRTGYAHSAEAWMNGELVGGLYGIKIGKIFFGESMFSKENNASKFAFIMYVKQLQKEQVHLIDCQIHTAHLASLGAIEITRSSFIKILNEYC